MIFKDTCVLTMYHALLADLMAKRQRNKEKQTQIYSNLLTL